MQPRKKGQPRKGWKNAARATKELRGPVVKTSDFDSGSSPVKQPPIDAIFCPLCLSAAHPAKKAHRIIQRELDLWDRKVFSSEDVAGWILEALADEAEADSRTLDSGRQITPNQAGARFAPGGLLRERPSQRT